MAGFPIGYLFESMLLEACSRRRVSIEICWRRHQIRRSECPTVCLVHQTLASLCSTCNCCRHQYVDERYNLINCPLLLTRHSARRRLNRSRLGGLYKVIYQMLTLLGNKEFGHVDLPCGQDHFDQTPQLQVSIQHGVGGVSPRDNLLGEFLYP